MSIFRRKPPAPAPQTQPEDSAPAPPRTLPTLTLHDEFAPGDAPYHFHLPARAPDGTTRAIIAITEAQARKLGFSTGLVQPELVDVWRNRARKAQAELKQLRAQSNT